MTKPTITKINHLVKCNNLRAEELTELKSIIPQMNGQSVDIAIQNLFEHFKESKNFEGVIVSSYIAELSDNPKIGLILQRPKYKSINIEV